MKRLFIFLSLFAYFNSDCRPLGQWLNGLTMHRILQNNDRSKFVKRNPEKGIYELKTLSHGKPGTCAIKDLLLTLNAFSRKQNPKTRQLLCQLFNKQKFNKLNRFWCAYNKKNIQQDGLNAQQIAKTLKSLQNGTFTRKYPRTKNLLPANLKQIMSNAMIQEVYPFDPKIAIKIELGLYKSKDDIIKILNGVTGSKKLLSKIRNLKKSNQQVLGVVLSYPKDISFKNWHSITLIINKANKNNFEFFILNSGTDNSQSGEWYEAIKFVKHLVNLPLATINEILNSPLLLDL